MVHRGDVLLRQEDADVAARFTALAGRQWDVRLGTTVEGVKPVGDGVRLDLSSGGDAEDVDVLLVATGRTPNSDLLDLGAAGVEVDDDGFVVVDEYQRTTAPGRLGARRRLQPAPAQARGQPRGPGRAAQPAPPGRRCRSATTGSCPVRCSARRRSRRVGLTEQEARDLGIDVARRRTQEYGDVAYGWAMEDTRPVREAGRRPRDGLPWWAHT